MRIACSTAGGAIYRLRGALIARQSIFPPFAPRGIFFARIAPSGGYIRVHAYTVSYAREVRLTGRRRDVPARCLGVDGGVGFWGIQGILDEWVSWAVGLIVL